jgi:hypothetical protein
MALVKDPSQNKRISWSADRDPFCHSRCFSCHPRESGDPGRNWVPAFAGMTGEAAG